MNDQNPTERQRRQRADLVNAFSRRAWQPSERPQAGPRILAGGLALIVVAGGAFAVGALTSYDHKKSAGERARMAAMAKAGAPASPQAVGATPPPTPIVVTPSPAAERHGAASGGAAAARRGGSGGKLTAQSRPAGSRLPRGPRFTTVKHVLIKNVMTGMCVDLPGNGYGRPDGKVEQFPCNGSSDDNMRFDLVVGRKGAGPHGADLFTIRNSKDGLCLDLPGYGVVAQADVTEYYCRPGAQDNQMWYLEKKANGRFWIRAYYSQGERCLDVDGTAGTGGPDAKLTIFPCSLQDDHLWSFS